MREDREHIYFRFLVLSERKVIKLRQLVCHVCVYAPVYAHAATLESQNTDSYTFHWEV
jgi:hypothetical protein